MLANSGGFIPLDSVAVVARPDGTLQSPPSEDFPVLVLFLVGFDFLSPSLFLEVQCFDLISFR